MRITGHGAEVGVDFPEDPVVQRTYACGSCPEDTIELSFALAQGFFKVFALGNIPDRLDGTGNGTILVIQEGSLCKNRAGLSPGQGGGGLRDQDTSLLVDKRVLELIDLIGRF